MGHAYTVTGARKVNAAYIIDENLLKLLDIFIVAGLLGVPCKWMPHLFLPSEKKEKNL